MYYYCEFIVILNLIYLNYLFKEIKFSLKKYVCIGIIFYVKERYSFNKS